MVVVLPLKYCRLVQMRVLDTDWLSDRLATTDDALVMLGC